MSPADDPPTNSPAARLNELLVEPEPRLDRIMAVIASIDADDAPTEDAVVSELDRLAGPVLAGDATETLAHVFGELGFTGDVADYYNPWNSFVHRVLERRKGIPISLAAVAAEIGRRHGHDLRLIGMPGHVLLGDGAEPSRWFDPFGGGRPLTVDDCRALFGRFHPIEAFNETMLVPMSADDTVTRMLTNLRVAYSRGGRVSEMIPVLELRVGMASSDVRDRMELANLLAVLGRFDRAADECDRLAELDSERADAYRARAATHRAHRN